MRSFAGILTLALALLLVTPASAAADDLPTTFSGCVLFGGHVRAVDGTLTCRLVLSWDFRVYYTGTTECGEEVELEAWGETHGGVMTTLFAPHLTAELPEDERELVDVPIGTPIHCLDD